MRACLNSAILGARWIGRGREVIPEGGCSNREGPVTPGPVLSPDGFNSVCAGRSEATVRGVEGEEVRKVGKGQVI